MINQEFELFKENKSLRNIGWNEIIFDIDNRECGFETINSIGFALANIGYNIEIWYAEGQKSPHLHVKGIIGEGIWKLVKEQLKKYKELFIRKYCPEEFIDFADFSLCTEHCIAAEWKPHFKYGTEKKLIASFNEWNSNKEEQEIIDKARKIKERNIAITSGITNKIIQKISIIDIARKYGIDVNSSNMAVCPFHADNKPSLKFYDWQGRFVCFGCGVKGNIIDFVYLLKKRGVENGRD